MTKLKKRPKSVADLRKATRIPSVEAAIGSALQMSYMLMAMQDNLGYTPPGEEAKRSLALGRVLEYNHGYAKSVARAIVTGTIPPKAKSTPDFQGAVMNFLLAEIHEMGSRGPMTYIDSTKNLCKWALREDADHAVAIVVMETAMRRFPTPEAKEQFMQTPEYAAYLEFYQPFLDIVGEIRE